MHTLTVPGTLDSLGPIRDFVKAAASEAGLDRKRAYQLQLAVDEIATNVITHGYTETGSEGDVDVRTRLTDETLTIYLEDTAAPFNPLTQDAPDNLDAPLEDRPAGGLGVYLAIHSVDRFVYERDGDRNRNVFVVNRADSQANAGTQGLSVV